MKRHPRLFLALWDWAAANGGRFIPALVLLGTIAMPAGAVVPSLGAFAYHQRPGNHVPMGTVLRDESGHRVVLRDLTANRPVILALGYFQCPNLCGVIRDDLDYALSRSTLRAGRDYTLVVLSIDPNETAADAARAKYDDIARYDLPNAAQGWHYLTGAPDQIDAVASAVGFRSRFDPEFKQFLHPAGIVFLAPDGIVSSYLLGVGYRPGDIALGVTRARGGGIAKAALPVLLLCFHFDPTTGRYTLAVTKLVEIGCILTVLTLGGTIALAFRKERRR